MPRPQYVIDGPRWVRTEIRHKGPLLALIPAVVLGLTALVCINLLDSKLSGQLGLVTAYFAAPALPMFGAPFSSSDRHPAAVVVSVVLWVIVGFVAARRATRNPMADWSDYWKNFWWMAGGIWLGSIVAMAVARFGIGGQLF
jgi:hypothetical protein